MSATALHWCKSRSRDALFLSLSFCQGFQQAPDEHSPRPFNAGTVILKPVGCLFADVDTILLNITVAWRDRG